MSERQWGSLETKTAMRGTSPVKNTSNFMSNFRATSSPNRFAHSPRGREKPSIPHLTLMNVTMSAASTQC